MAKKRKIESLDEYIARGGSIKKIPEAIRDVAPSVVKKTTAGDPAIFLTLEEADLLYGETRKGSKPKKAKPSLKIDLSALPEALRTKFINRLKEENDGEDYEESIEEEDEESDD